MEGAALMGAKARVLVPVDGSEASVHAAALAGRVAEATDAAVDLLFIGYFDEETDGDEELDTWLPQSEALAPVKGAASCALTKAKEAAGAGVSVFCHRRTGIPAEEIVSYAEEANSALIVMGARGLSAVESFFLGSVSQTVMEKAKVPVLIVK